MFFFGGGSKSLNGGGEKTSKSLYYHGYKAISIALCVANIEFWGHSEMHLLLTFLAYHTGSQATTLHVCFPGIHPRVAIGSWTKRPTNILEIFIFRFFVGWDGRCNGVPPTTKMVSISYITISNPSQPSGVMTICNRGSSRTSANIVRKPHGEFGNAWFGLGFCGDTLSCKHSPWKNPPFLPG